MDFSTVFEFLKQFETGKVMAYVQSLNLEELMANPYILAGIGSAAIFAYIMKWRLLLVTVMSITGFIYLLSYTLAQGTSLKDGIPTEAMAVLIGGGSFIVFLAIYILFIRNE